LLIPVGKQEQMLIVVERTDAGFEYRELEPVRFVPLLPGIGNV
ncbi:MAG: protein-L-isoaspartate(D-aspartate) O-methyltransferase, partial [Halieaceae bacterium]